MEDITTQLNPSRYGSAVHSTLKKTGDMLELRTEIEIKADPKTVWRVLTDFDRYPEWNPFVLRIQGQLNPGQRLEAQLDAGGGKRMTIKPRVVLVDDERKFAWLGHLLFPGLFDGQHAFELVPTEAGVLFKHSERFGGVLVPFLRRMLEGNTRRSFIAMNEALKARAEAE